MSGAGPSSARRRPDEAHAASSSWSGSVEVGRRVAALAAVPCVGDDPLGGGRDGYES